MHWKFSGRKADNFDIVCIEIGVIKVGYQSFSQTHIFICKIRHGDFSPDTNEVEMIKIQAYKLLLSQKIPIFGPLSYISTSDRNDTC